MKVTGVFSKWSRTFTEFDDFSKFRESDKSQKYEWGQFKDLVSHMYLTSAVVALWSLSNTETRLLPFKAKYIGRTPLFRT